MRIKIGIIVCLMLAAVALQSVENVPKPTTHKEVAVPRPAYLKPLITNALSVCAATGQLEVYGKNFGDSQGNRVVRVNGVALPGVLAWGANLIRCSHTYAFPGGEIVHVDIFNAVKNVRASNVFDYLFPFCVQDHDPAGDLKPKSTVFVLIKPDVGASAWGRKVMVGSMEANAQWLGNKIKIVVPLLDPGAYTLRLVKNGQLISNEYPVTVK